MTLTKVIWKRMMDTKRDTIVFPHYWDDTSTSEILIPDGVIWQVVSVSGLTWFIRCIYYWNSLIMLVLTKLRFPSPRHILDFLFRPTICSSNLFTLVYPMKVITETPSACHTLDVYVFITTTDSLQCSVFRGNQLGENWPLTFQDWYGSTKYLKIAKG